jgi:hypothetical protein
VLFSNLKASYPDFQKVYQTHFREAKFETVLRRNGDFKARKLGLVSVQCLEKQRLRPEKRVQLVQFLLRGDFDSAQGILQESRSLISRVTSTVSSFFSSPGSSKAWQGEMKDRATRLSDSQFLLDMKGVHDKVLKPMIQDIEVLSYSLLSSLIGTTVNSMYRAVVAMQQEFRKTTLQDEIKSKVMKLRNKELREFIRKLNAQSVGRKDPYVLSDIIFIKWK